jgi:hypothetical protein
MSILDYLDPISGERRKCHNGTNVRPTGGEVMEVQSVNLLTSRRDYSRIAQIAM